MNGEPRYPASPTSEGLSLDPRSSATLRTLLEGAPSLVPFAEAAVVHLTYNDPSAEARARAIARIAAVLDVDDDNDDEARANLLAQDPPLLASIFQNMDLLDPADPASDALARLVITVLERIGDVPD